MTEPESKPSQKALLFCDALAIDAGYPRKMRVALALDAAIAAGAEAALRRQAEVKQPGEEPAMAIAREGIRRVAKERDEALANYREAVSATERVIVERDEAVAELKVAREQGDHWSRQENERAKELAAEKAAHEATRKELATERDRGALLFEAYRSLQGSRMALIEDASSAAGKVGSGEGG